VQGAERLWDPQSLLFNGSRVFIALGLRRPAREGTNGQWPPCTAEVKEWWEHQLHPLGSGPRGQSDMSVFLELLAVSKMCLSKTSEQLPASGGKVCLVCWASQLYRGCPISTFTKAALTAPNDVATYTCTKQPKVTGASCRIVQIAVHNAKCCQLSQIRTQMNSSTVSAKRLSGHSAYMLKNGAALSPHHHTPIWRA